MKAYKNTQSGITDAVFVVDEIGFCEAELTAKEEMTVTESDLHSRYYVLYEWERECHADNDGGIDSFDFGEEKLALAPENCVFYNGEIIGFYFRRRFFPLKDGASAVIGGCNETVAGWGSLSSDSSYTLKKK